MGKVPAAFWSNDKAESKAAEGHDQYRDLQARRAALGRWPLCYAIAVNSLAEGSLGHGPFPTGMAATMKNPLGLQQQLKVA